MIKANNYDPKDVLSFHRPIVQQMLDDMRKVMVS